MRLTERVHQALSELLAPGDCAIDATMGNGYDTLFLANSVGPKGKVWAFDIQEAALESTRKRLIDGESDHVTLVHSGHETMKAHLPEDAYGQIKAIVFNLGYLPGTDKSVTTHAESTLSAIEAGLELLSPTGAIHILCYTGHSEGYSEWQQLQEWMSQQAPEKAHIRLMSSFDEERRPPVWIELSRRLPA
ncbi:MAG: class I SAM-dependent methyltransferase [Opitutales bacterium]